MFFVAEKAPDLRAYYSHPALEAVRTEHPRNVVVIFGESFSRSHSSLYGYDKATNPRLAQLRDSGSLYVFSDVSAPATHTIAAFKQLMSTYSEWSGLADGRAWYEYVTLPEVLRHCGYTTFWLSNQAQKGMFDNVITKYAELCDTVCFVTGKFNAWHGIKYDESVIKLLSLHLGDGGDYRAFFLHLIGSHGAYSCRYPASFARFGASDYPNLPINQRQTIAEYDNSVLYNDSVVREMIRAFETEESVVIYFPDHGLDLFDSAPDFVGHARSQDARSVAAARQIPFMIYVSPKYRQRFPETVARMERNLSAPYCTDAFIYTVMDIVGYRFADSDDVATHTLLQ